MLLGTEFRAGLRRSHLDRVPAVSQPTCFLESTRSNVLPFTFHVWSRHSCPLLAENEGLCFLRELACLMGARSFATANFGLYGVEVASILETGQSAAYSSLHRKTRHAESGEFRSHAHRNSEQVCQRGVMLFLICNWWGVPTVPLHPTLQSGDNPTGEGSWACAL